MPLGYTLMQIIETGRQNIFFIPFPCGKKSQPFGETPFLPGVFNSIFVPAFKNITIKN